MTYEEKIYEATKLTKVQAFFYYAKFFGLGAVFALVLIMLKF